MTALFDHQAAIRCDLRSAPTSCGSGLRQAGERVKARDRPRGPADRFCVFADLPSQVAEQFVLALGGPGTHLKNLSLPCLEVGGDEAFLIRQGLAANPVVWNGA